MAKLDMKEKKALRERIQVEFEGKLGKYNNLLLPKDSKEIGKARRLDEQMEKGILAQIATEKGIVLDYSPWEVTFDYTSDEGRKSREELLQVLRLAIKKMDGKVSAESAFRTRMYLAVETFADTEGKEGDVAAFKQSFKEAIDIYALAFRKHGDATLMDKVKAAGMAVLGVIVTLLTSPAFLMPNSIHDHGQWLKSFHFFAGAETDKSKAAQAEMDDKFISDLVAAPGA